MKHRINLSPSTRNRVASTSSEGSELGSGAKDTEKETLPLSSCCAMIKSEERGHRLGNFHNYYTFNPTSNRISILEKLDIIRYLQEQLPLVDELYEEHHDDNSDDTPTGGQKRLPKRLKSSQEGTATSPGKLNTTKNNLMQPMTYCDLGCNEGDLTMCLSEHLIQSQTKKTADNTKQEVRNKGVVEKQGNIRNTISCLGLDIDSTLIERANEKYVSQPGKHDHDDSNGRLIDASFQICNIGNNIELRSKCEHFLQTVQSKYHEKKQQMFDLISIFSTTMWIHIHHGDDGLRLLLQTICSLSNYVLIEPQPSKCYRNVNARLRKLNFEEVDVSIDRLKMRTDIENEIEKVFLSCGFEQVDITAHFNAKEDLMNLQVEKSGENKFDRTAWNRTLKLYKRSNFKF